MKELYTDKAACSQDFSIISTEVREIKNKKENKGEEKTKRQKDKDAGGRRKKEGRGRREGGGEKPFNTIRMKKEEE